MPVAAPAKVIKAADEMLAALEGFKDALEAWANKSRDNADDEDSGEVARPRRKAPNGKVSAKRSKSDADDDDDGLDESAEEDDEEVVAKPTKSAAKKTAKRKPKVEEDEDEEATDEDEEPEVDPKVFNRLKKQFTEYANLDTPGAKKLLAKYKATQFSKVPASKLLEFGKLLKKALESAQEATAEDEDDE